MIGQARDSREKIEARATDFVQRRRFWDWSPDDDAALETWLEESVTHRVAFLRLTAGAARIERLAALRPARSQAGPERRLRTDRLRRLLFPLLVGPTSLAVIAILGVALTHYFLRPSDRTFATDVGGHAVLKFADGTQVELNTDTAIRYRMTTEERIVWLDHGEGYFRVAHDAAHPFVVIAGTHRVTDLGTEFLLRSGGSDLEVALVKGRAELASDDPHARRALLTPGDDAIATDQSVSITRKTPQQIADELAWQRGVLVFRNTPLADAVAQFNRYNRTKLVIGDPGAAALRVGGEFRADNLSDFLLLAQLVLKVRTETKGTDIWLFRDDGNRGETVRSP
jgi:transmembrane sensor